ncbi:MAG: sulfatase [Planctomycetota bacterium]
MNRRRFLQATALGVTALNASRRARSAEGPRRPPNFIVIFTDDQGYGDLGCFGSKTCRTPRIDRMAAQGLKLTSFYVAAPVCTPSRAALMTGCYPFRVGLPSVLFPNSMPRGQRGGKAIGLNPDETTIAEALETQDYATACIGKWHLGDLPVFQPTRHGFDHYFGLPYSNDMHVPFKRWAFPPLPLIRDGEVVETEPDQDRLTRRYTEDALRFIKANRDRPFFLYLAHSMPHRPIHASEPFRKGLPKAKLAAIQGEDKRSRDFLYPAAIAEIDWSTGQILDALAELGLDDRTLVVFTSDNGPATGSAGPLRGKKGSTFEGGMRVPCVARWPGRVPAGTTCDAVATAMDLLPTFASLAGAEVPADRVIDGRDIWPLLSGQADARSPHEAFFYLRGPRVAAVRSGRWKLHFRKRGRKPWALYDLEADIGEKHNLAAKHPEVVQRLTQVARAFEADLKAHSRPAGTAPIPKS